MVKISVALCTYNGEKFLHEQLNSILNQTHPVDEIIVCDDRSTDTTISILEEYQSKHPKIITIIVNENTLRSVKNFEKAISLCTGDIIFLSDQDDIWVNTKTEKYCEFFSQNPSIQVLASNGYCIDDKSIVHEKYALWDIPMFLREQNIKIDYLKTITYFSNIATGASMAFRKEILSEIFPFPLIKDFYHDEWIATIASSKNAFELLNEKYFYYRIHSNQQVGGIFSEKTEEQKQSLIDYYNQFSLKKDSFLFIKRKINKIVEIYNKNQKIIDERVNHIEIFEKNVDEIKLLYLATVKEIKQKYPIRYFILKIVDKIRNKRQLKR